MHKICVYKFLVRPVGPFFLLSLKSTFNLSTQDSMTSKKNSVIVANATAIGGKKKASSSSGSSTVVSKANCESLVTRNKMKSGISYLVKPLNHHGKKRSTKKNPSRETSSQEKIMPVVVLSSPEIGEDVSFWLSDAHSNTGSSSGSLSREIVYTSSQSYSIAMPSMMTRATTVEEQLAQMTTAIAKLTKTVEEKDLQIANLMNKLEQKNLTRSSHGPSHPPGFTPQRNLGNQE